MKKWKNPELKSIGLAVTAAKGDKLPGGICPDCLCDFGGTSGVAAHRGVHANEINPGQGKYGGKCPNPNLCRS